jgi:hypothetical protein
MMMNMRGLAFNDPSETQNTPLPTLEFNVAQGALSECTEIATESSQAKAGNRCVECMNAGAWVKRWLNIFLVNNGRYERRD